MQNSDYNRVLKQKLLRNKYIATGLLIIAIVTFFIANKYLDYAAWVKYVKYFAEASMVGALADWFAVVALFKKPLGLPIPHTAILPRSQAKLAKQIGIFFTSNFLSDKSIPKFIYQAQLIKSLFNWLQQEPNKKAIAKIIYTQAIQVLTHTNLSKIQTYLNNFISKNITGKHLANISNMLLTAGINNQYEQKIINKFLIKIHKNIESERSIQIIRELIRDYVNKDNTRTSNSLFARISQALPNLKQEVLLYDDWLPKKIAKLIDDYCLEVLSNEQHSVRALVTTQLTGLQQQLISSAKMQNKLYTTMQTLLNSDSLRDVSTELINDLVKFVQLDYQKDDSVIKNSLVLSITFILDQLLANEQLIKQFEARLYVASKMMLANYKVDVASYLENKINQWDSQELVSLLELYVGSDLQYIRMNGTIVGGLIGLLICFLSNL